MTLGDGRALEITGQGNVTLKALLPNGKCVRCHLKDVLLVPDLAYNLLSVTKAVEAGKGVQFQGDHCHITDGNQKLMVTANKANGLYYVNCDNNVVHMTATESAVFKREAVWHKRFGHLSLSSLRRLHNMVEGLTMILKRPPYVPSFANHVFRGKVIDYLFHPVGLSGVMYHLASFTVMSVAKSMSSRLEEPSISLHLSMTVRGMFGYMYCNARMKCSRDF